MGRRSRNRAPAAPAARRQAAPAPRRPGGRPRIEDRPKPPWHPFPLVELSVLLGIVCLVLGFMDLGSERGRLLLLCGMALGSLAGLDTALREHFAGYRSHSLVLAGLPAVALAAGLFFVGAPWPAVVLGAVAAFGAAFWWLRRTYARKVG
jgi:hypothetical protein